MVIMNSDERSATPIVTLFERQNEDSITSRYYREVVTGTLKRVLPAENFDPRLLPIVSLSGVSSPSSNLSFVMISKYRSNSFKFFFEMISRWLIPGKRLDVVLVHASDFRFYESSSDLYTVCEIIVRVENQGELDAIKKRYPAIQSEILLGAKSAYYAQRILEQKGLSADEKTASIQEFIALLVQRFPDVYEYDIFIEMQHLLLMSHDSFKEQRLARHLSRMISAHYLFRRSILDDLKKNWQHRYTYVKLFRAKIQGSLKQKSVLGVLVGINLLTDQETFREKHLINSVLHSTSSTKIVDDSFFMSKMGVENVLTMYIEVEKIDGSEFTNSEIKRFREALPVELKNRIEYKQHPIFMPRNEEEIMRNILTLSQQIKYVRDIPQVLISFDHQTHSHLYFTIIVVRVLKDGSKPLSNLFDKSNPQFKYIHDRVKNVGLLRRKYHKEATVFRLKLPKELFLRNDQSIDLYKARQVIVEELFRLLGDIRDYNGGMISKQHAVLSHIHHLLGNREPYDTLLMEDFFYSLIPDVIRTLIDPHSFITLFFMLVQSIKDVSNEKYQLNIQIESYNTFIMITSNDSKLKEYVVSRVEDLHIPYSELTLASVTVNEHLYMGYITCIKDSGKKSQFLETVQNAVEGYFTKGMVDSDLNLIV